MRRPVWDQWERPTLNAQRSTPNVQRRNRNQKLIVKSLMPLHFPVSGSSSTLSSALPYFAGAFGLSIWRGLPCAARTSTPPFSVLTGGGVGIGLAFFLTFAVKVFFCTGGRPQ